MTDPRDRYVATPDGGVMVFYDEQASFPMLAGVFSGVRIMVDCNALAETTERTFPISRHRSARIRKKLIKRFGGEFRKEPAMFQIAPALIVCHPAIYAELRRQLDGAGVVDVDVDRKGAP